MKQGKQHPETKDFFQQCAPTKRRQKSEFVLYSGVTCAPIDNACWGCNGDSNFVPVVHRWGTDAFVRIPLSRGPILSPPIRVWVQGRWRSSSKGGIGVATLKSGSSPWAWLRGRWGPLPWACVQYGQGHYYHGYWYGHGVVGGGHGHGYGSLPTGVRVQVRITTFWSGFAGNRYGYPLLQYVHIRPAPSQLTVRSRIPGLSGYEHCLKCFLSGV